MKIVVAISNRELKKAQEGEIMYRIMEMPNTGPAVEKRITVDKIIHRVFEHNRLVGLVAEVEGKRYLIEARNKNVLWKIRPGTELSGVLLTYLANVQIVPRPVSTMATLKKPAWISIERGYAWRCYKDKVKIFSGQVESEDQRDDYTSIITQILATHTKEHPGCNHSNIKVFRVHGNEYYEIVNFGLIVRQEVGTDA